MKKLLTNRLLIRLIRLKFGLKLNQKFRFANQKNTLNTYYFKKNKLMKITYIKNGTSRFCRESRVKLKWMLISRDCKIIKVRDL